MIKAAFFDIDGTLLSFKTHLVSPGTIQAFEELHRQGIHTFISSGRPKVLIPPMPVGFDGYVTMNGGYCFVENQVLLRNPIPQQETDRWLQYAEQENLCTMIFTEHEMFVNTHSNPVANAIRNQLEFQMPPLLPTRQMMGRETFQVIAIMPAERDNDVLQMLPHCRLPRWHPQFSDLVNADNSKATGIDSILHHYGIDRNECIGFGDGGNDIEMLDFCGIGVAMGNADDNVKAHADYVTTSVDDEGIANALRQLHII
jgi:Cof subfamily protein (haloacid dehalogenase superfamily)